jgi:hypothetical protein
MMRGQALTWRRWLGWTARYGLLYGGAYLGAASRG